MSMQPQTCITPPQSYRKAAEEMFGHVVRVGGVQSLTQCSTNVLRESADRAECFAQTSPTCVAVFYVFSTLPASGRFASEGLVCFAQGITVRYAVGRLGTRSHAFFLHGTRVRSTCNRERYAAAGNSALACEDQTKACVYARLPRGAKLADLARHTRFVCAILGLSRRARIQGLRKKILGWCESTLCA